MRIAGLQKNSFVDYPGKIAAVVFTQGCNFDCYYCHNSKLIPRKNIEPLLPEGLVLNFLEERKDFLDAVVITGGEPTLQAALTGFIEKIREKGLAVKLDTNGTNPQLLEKLIEKGLLDYVAMDFKAPFSKYSSICGKHVELKKIMQSIEILLRGNCEYEFRTTYVSRLTKEDILEIAFTIRGANRYVLQQVRYDNILIERRKDFWEERAHPGAYLQETAEIVKEYVPNCFIRGLK